MFKLCNKQNKTKILLALFQNSLKTKSAQREQWLHCWENRWPNSLKAGS